MTAKNSGNVTPRRSSFLFTLQGRLILTFLFIALIPIGLLAFITTRNTQQALTTSGNQALLAAAKQTANTVDWFLLPNIYAVDEKAQSLSFIYYLSLPKDEQQGNLLEKQAYNEIMRLKDENYLLNHSLQAYMILDKNGLTLLDTSTQTPDQSVPYLALDRADPQRFELLLKSNLPYVSSVIFPANGSQPVFYFVAKISNTKAETIGFLLAQYDAAYLQALVDQNAGLVGEKSYAALYDENHLVLANGLSPDFMYKMVTTPSGDQAQKLVARSRLPATQSSKIGLGIPALENGLKQFNSSLPIFRSLSPDSHPVMTAGAVVQLKNAPWLVSYMTPESTFLAPVQQQTLNIARVAIFIAVVTLILGVFISRRLTRPITMLTQVAEKVTGGDLHARAPVSNDEIGLLASAFNTMTSELRHILEGLEQRVTDRTAELSNVSGQMETRANQLQTVSEVARAIAMLKDTGELLNQITYLVSERFGYYHVGIFLIDENQEYAWLRAANSDGGQRMLERGHHLLVGQVGIVGYVTGNGEPRIALDVGEDAVYFDNPDLPATRSEMALPLKIGERVIGALDVQSTLPNAFREVDIPVLSTLADQVAIAIENNRLYSETRKALTELQTLHGQYLSQSWAKVAAERQRIGYLIDQGRLLPMDTAQMPADSESIQENNSILLFADQDHAGYSSELQAPINVRGQIIGVLNLSEREPGYEWTDEERNLVKNIVDQIGLALENARLIEQTQRRAEREHLVAEISTKLRSSNDAQEILETARREIQQALKVRKAEIIFPTIAAPGGSISSTMETGGNGRLADEDPDLETELGGAE